MLLDAVMSTRTLTLTLVLTLLFTLVASVPIDLTVASVTPPTTWSKNYPQLQGSGRAIIQTSDGGYAVGGVSNNMFLLLKTTSKGTPQWWKTYGTGEAYSIVQTSEGGYALAGYGSSNLVKTDSAGEIELTKEYKKGTLSYMVKSLVQTSDGGYAMAGWNYATTMGSPSGDWVVKTDTTGNVQWNRTYGGSMATGILETSEGDLILTANELIYKLDRNGDVQWSHDCVLANGLAKAEDGGYVLVAGTGAALVKTDSEGVTQWSKSFVEGGWNFFDSVKQTRDGGYIVSGVMFPYEGWAWIVKTDSDGNEEWSITYEPVATSNSRAYSVIEVNDGGFVFCGEKGVRGGWQTGDVWLVKIGGSGGNELPIDTTPPVVSIILPENKTYYSASITLEFSLNEPLSRMGFRLDRGFVEIAGNTTITVLSLGQHNLTVYATDLFGNTGASETVHFSISEEPKEESFPTNLVIGSAIAVVAVVAGLGLLVYHKKRKREAAKA